MAGVKFSTQIDGVDRLVRQMRLAQPAVQARIKKTIERRSVQVLAASEAKVPKRTGELASTGRVEYANGGLVGMIKYGYGTLVRRSKALTEKGKARFAKARQKRNERKLHLALANTSKQALSVADLGVYAPIPDRGDSRRHIRAQHYLSEPFEQAKPAIIADFNRDLTQTVNEMGDTV